MVEPTNHFDMFTRLLNHEMDYCSAESIWQMHFMHSTFCLKRQVFNLHLLETPLTRKDCVSKTSLVTNTVTCVVASELPHIHTQQRGGLIVRRNMQMPMNHLTGCNLV